jgi:hypothetical protein
LGLERSSDHCNFLHGIINKRIGFGKENALKGLQVFHDKNRFGSCYFKYNKKSKALDKRALDTI